MQCAKPARNIDARVSSGQFVGAETFSPAGDALFHGESDDCTEKILKGDLHAVLIINNVEVFGTYWTSWRMCIPCALSEHIVEFGQTFLQTGEKK